jgi:hypothetical protein
MTTPILPMIPKTIVALGESTDVMDRGCDIDVELGKEGMVMRRFDEECNR